MKSIHNLTVDDPADILQQLWCVGGEWQLLVRHHGKGTAQYKNLHVWDTEAVRPYSVKNDPNELKNLEGERAERVTSLPKEIAVWWKPKAK